MAWTIRILGHCVRQIYKVSNYLCNCSGLQSVVPPLPAQTGVLIIASTGAKIDL